MIYVAFIAIGLLAGYFLLTACNLNARISRIEKRLKFDEDAGERFE